MALIIFVDILYLISLTKVFKKKTKCQFGFFLYLYVNIFYSFSECILSAMRNIPKS